MKRRTYNRKEMVPAVAIAIGSAVSLLMGILLSGLAAYLTISEVLHEQYGQVVVPVIHTLSVVVGGYITRILSADKKMWLPLVTMLVYLLILAAAHILMIDAPLTLSGASIIGLLAAAMIFVAIQFMGSREGKFKYRKI